MTSGRPCAPPATIVIFGASGDLAARKLLPALDRLRAQSLLHAGTVVIGVGRSTRPDGWRGPWVQGDYKDVATHLELRHQLAAAGPAGANRLYYLSVPPSLFGTVAVRLGEAGLAEPGPGGSFARLVVEKPFGVDLASARALDEALHRHFHESQVFRIDHYLGKETVQNLLALRFANAVFEPLWSRQYLDSVQITIAEEGGVGDRAGFYEQAGALRDIVQNHALQVLALVAMEAPSRLDAERIRDEKVKLLSAVEVLEADAVGNEVVRAQYAGYRDEKGVDPASTTETFVAMRLHVDNWRWAGVPFYLRSGKRLPKRVTEVALRFQRVPHLAFAAGNARALGPNELLLRIQPDEGIRLSFGAKVPGPDLTVRTVHMDMSWAEEFGAAPADSYELLLHEALLGDATLFIRSDEVEAAWAIVEPVLEAWRSDPSVLPSYEPGTWGPREADRLLEREGRRWRNP